MIFYKTSFNSLVVPEPDNVYKAYNLSAEEFESFSRTFHGQINGSKGNYTSFYKAKRHVWLNLLVHDLWIPIKIDVRDDILKITESDRIQKKSIEKISKELEKQRLQLKVVYDYSSEEKYHILPNEYEKFLAILKSLL